MSHDTALRSSGIRSYCFAQKLAVVIVIALGFLVLPALHAQQIGTTGQVSGRVSNLATGEYLRNAQIRIEGTSLTTVAGNGGEYTLRNVPAGEHRIIISYTGLSTATLPVIVDAGQTARLDADLTSPTYGEDIVQLGRFVVSTEREGNAKAIMDQRSAVNMKKVVAADALGNVSEGNVGEFLKQMPGVAMDYVESEVRQVRIRGYSPKYASVTMDGARVASAGSSDINVGRAFEFEQLSIASVDTVELSKTPTPDQPSTVAGTVNLRSKSAFDRKGRRIAYSTSLYFNSEYTQTKVYGWDDKAHYAFAPNASFEYSDILIPDRLGVAFGVNYSSVVAAQKNVRVRSYAFDTDPTNNATEVPRMNGFDFKDTPKLTVRNNYNLKLDYKLSESLSTYVKIDYNEYDSTFFNRYVVLDAPNNTATTGVVNSPDPDGPSGPLLAGPTIPGVEYSRSNQTILGGRARLDGGANNKFGDTLILATGFELKLGALTNTTDLSFSRARNWYEALRRGYFEGYAATTPWDLDFQWIRPSGPQDKSLFVRDLPGSLDWRDINNYIFGNAHPQTDAGLIPSLRENIRRGRDRVWSARSDFTLPTRLANLPVTLKFGAATTLNIRDTHPRVGLGYILVGPDGIPNSGDGDLPKDWLEEKFHADAGWGPASVGWPAIDRHRLAKLHKSNPEYFRPAIAQHLEVHLRNRFYFKERIDAAYAQANFRIGKLSIAPGIRYEHTDSTGKGSLDIGDRQARRILTGTPNGLMPPAYPTNTVEYVQTRYGSRQTAGNRYGDAFGYLHSTYRITPALIARFSGHQAVTRADMANMIPGIGAVNEDTQRFNINNPALKPEFSRNLNASLEYYFEPTGVLSLSVFRSDIEDIQRRTLVPASETIYAADPVLSSYEANIWSNVAKAHTSGLELDYTQQLGFLPAPLNGLSVTANYTRIRFDKWENFFGSPKDMWNTALSFSRGRFFISYKLNFTGKKLFSRPANGWDVYDTERLMMDLNATYKLSDRFTFFANARNLTNNAISRYAGDKGVWLHHYRQGTMWELGVKGSF